MRVLLEAGAIGKPVDGVKLLGEVCKWLFLLLL
jgi:hypothetical protein